MEDDNGAAINQKNMQRKDRVVCFEKEMQEEIKQYIDGELVKSFETQELGRLATEYAELGLDSIIDDDVVKGIPILRTAVSLAKIGLNIRDRLYVKKIVMFLVQVGGTAQEQREEFIKKHCKDNKKFEEAVFLLLENSDRTEKVSLIGKVFKACILGMIHYANTFQISEMVNRAYWADLKDMFNGNESEEQQQRLFTVGLMEFDPKTFQFATTDGIGLDVIRKLRYKRNAYANTLTMIHQERFENIAM